MSTRLGRHSGSRLCRMTSASVPLLSSKGSPVALPPAKFGGRNSGPSPPLFRVRARTSSESQLERPREWSPAVRTAASLRPRVTRIRWPENLPRHALGRSRFGRVHLSRPSRSSSTPPFSRWLTVTPDVIRLSPMTPSSRSYRPGRIMRSAPSTSGFVGTETAGGGTHQQDPPSALPRRYRRS